MKKSNFAALILGTIGTIFFGLGMCMCLLPEWAMSQQGIIAGIIGLAILLITVVIWRKMAGKPPLKVHGKLIASTVTGILGAWTLGAGMCLTMLFGKIILGIVIGAVGIVILLMLVPLLKGLK